MPHGRQAAEPGLLAPLRAEGMPVRMRQSDGNPITCTATGCSERVSLTMMSGQRGMQADVLGRASIDEQVKALQAMLSQKPMVLDVLDRTAQLRLPSWYLTAGCLVQPVWNVLTGRPPGDGIRDYDVSDFDDSDLSWQAEDTVIRR